MGGALSCRKMHSPTWSPGARWCYPPHPSIDQSCCTLCWAVLELFMTVLSTVSVSLIPDKQDTAEITLPAMCEHRTLLLRGTVHEAHHPPSEYDKKLNLAEAKLHLEIGCLAC